MRRADFLTCVAFAITVVVSHAGAPQGSTPPRTPTGTLRLTIEPPSIVLIDNEQIGEIERRSIELPVGPHRVRIVHPDFQPLRRTIDVRASELIELVIDLYEKGVPSNPGVIPSRPAGTRPTPRPREQPAETPAPVAQTSQPPPQVKAPEPPAEVKAPEPPAPAKVPGPPAPTPTVHVPETIPPAPVAQPAAPVAPPPVLDGELRVRIEPPAEVWVDGVRQGVYGEGTIAVSAGRHDVRIVHDDYQPLNRRLTVTREKPAVLDLKLADRAVPKAQPQP